MATRIAIERNVKIMLLKALKKGYFENSDLETLETIVSKWCRNISDEELDNKIQELHKKLGYCVGCIEKKCLIKNF